MSQWKGKTRGGSFGYLFFILLIKKCGINAAYAFLCMVVPYFIPFAPRATKSIWVYSRKVLKVSMVGSIAMLIRNYYTLGQILIDRLALRNGMKNKYNFRFENHSRFLDILNSDQGVIVIGAHVGSWEAGVPFFEEYGKKINIVMYDAEYQKIKEVLDRHTTDSDYKVIPINNDGLSHMLTIKEALDNNEYVCFQGDRYVNEERCIRRTFMGQEAVFPTGPFLLASRLKVPVVFYFSMRERNKTYRFQFIIAKRALRQKDTKRELLLLDQYIEALEEILKRYPEQWFNYYDFWKKNKILIS